MLVMNLLIKFIRKHALILGVVIIKFSTRGLLGSTLATPTGYIDSRTFQSMLLSLSFYLPSLSFMRALRTILLENKINTYRRLVPTHNAISYYAAKNILERLPG